MQLRRFEKKIGFHSNVRPVRVSENANVCVLITATSAQTPKMIARRRQVVNGVAGAAEVGVGGESTISGNVGLQALDGEPRPLP
jgi:hypothetical protein